MRGTSNRIARGNTKDRAARRAWLMRSYASNIPGYCRCYRCGILLYDDMVTVDRIIPGCKGGKYVRNNIRPACGDCNQETGSQLGVARRKR